MKYIPTIFACMTLLACGADVATTAAEAALMKKQEIEQGQKTMDQARQKINQSVELMQQRVQKTQEAAER